jgi:pteridine reductase
MLQGKTALVTGGAARIGAACVEALAAAGADVVVHFHSSGQEAQKVAESARARGVRAGTVRGDLASEEQTRAIFSSALELTGGIDILVNSASIFPGEPLGEAGFASLEENSRVNAWAPLLLSQLFASQKRYADRENAPEAEGLGNIVNLLDTRITDYDRHHAAYSLSKRSLFSITRMLSVEYAPAIKVNAVAPGLILPPRGEGPEYLRRMADTNPMRRCGSIADVTSALLFLITTTFITGQVIFVDGGRRTRGSMYGT